MSITIKIKKTTSVPKAEVVVVESQLYAGIIRKSLISQLRIGLKQIIFFLGNDAIF